MTDIVNTFSLHSAIVEISKTLSNPTAERVIEEIQQRYGIQVGCLAVMKLLEATRPPISFTD